ncbi:MAG: transposase [Microvirga sp.]|nr:transposase [Microvirga sp.]
MSRPTAERSIVAIPNTTITSFYLAIEDIDHSRTKTKSQQTNGIAERFHKTVLDEFYRVAFCKKIYPRSRNCRSISMPASRVIKNNAAMVIVIDVSMLAIILLAVVNSNA